MAQLMGQATIAAQNGPPFGMMGLLRLLFPIPRSITGDGVRQTLRVLQDRFPLSIHEVPSGTPVFDWEVPDEWNIRSGVIKTLTGQTIVDFAENALHVVSYSGPVEKEISRSDLEKHVHTLPQQPDAIPYRTGYYARDWGFCLRHTTWLEMEDERYFVKIDSDLSPGSLTYGEYFIPGTTDEEILVSVHICHPNLANDNLSGIVVAAALAAQLSKGPARRKGLRFLFLPATIGAITWLAKNEDDLHRISHGLVLTCIGDSGPFHYKKSRSAATIDRAVQHVLHHSPHAYEVLPFSPYGYDERQYGSPGLNLPVGCFMRAVHGTFPEYHTSYDNCDFVDDNALTQSFDVLRDILDLLDNNIVLRRIDGRGEPQLGRRGLYRLIAGQQEAGGTAQMDLLWLLNLADGSHSLLEIADEANVPFRRIMMVAQIALEAQLVEEAKR
jgi:aminopeptidase-like protein